MYIDVHRNVRVYTIFNVLTCRCVHVYDRQIKSIPMTMIPSYAKRTQRLPFPSRNHAEHIQICYQFRQQCRRGSNIFCQVARGEI
jgi:hypothetical protein